MAFSIRNPEAEAMAREIVSLTGHSLTVAITDALRQRLAQLKAHQNEDKTQLVKDLREIGRRFSKLPKLSDATDDEVFGWDEAGLPT